MDKDIIKVITGILSDYSVTKRLGQKYFKTKKVLLKSEKNILLTNTHK